MPSEENIFAAIGAGLGFVIVIALFWGFISSMVWALGSPVSNFDRCSAIAKSQKKEFATTGWRNDTCYLYKDGKEESVKL